MTKSGSLPFLLPTCSCLPLFSVRCGVFVRYLLRSLNVVCHPPTNLAFLFTRNMIRDCTAGVRRRQLVGWSQPKAAAYLNCWSPPGARRCPPTCMLWSLVVICHILLRMVCSPSVAALHWGTTMGCETYPPIINFLSPSVVRRPTSNARMIWQTVFDRHRLLLLIISANVLWSIKGVGVERRYEGPTTWPRKNCLTVIWMDGGEFGCQTR